MGSARRMRRDRTGRIDIVVILLMVVVLVIVIAAFAVQAPTGTSGNTTAIAPSVSLSASVPSNGTFYGESSNFTTPTCKDVFGWTTGCGQGWSLTGQVSYGKTVASGQLCVVQILGGGGRWCGTVTGGGSCTIITCSTDIANIIPAIGKAPLITGGAGTFVLLFTSSTVGTSVSFPNGIQMVNANVS